MVTYAAWDTDCSKFWYYEVRVLDFGSSHARWWPVRVAHLSSRVLNKIGIPAVVRIDDAVMLPHPDTCWEQLVVSEL